MEDIQNKCTEFNVTPAAIIPISAKHGHGIEELEAALTGALPESPFMFPADQVTVRSERFLAAELIREKLMRFLGDEVPHSTAVEIEKFKLEPTFKLGNPFCISMPSFGPSGKGRKKLL